MAIEVTAVALDKSSIRLEVRNIGTPNVVNKNGTIEGCANVDVFSFQVNGFDMDQPRDQERKVLGLSYRRQPAHDGAMLLGSRYPLNFRSKDIDQMRFRATTMVFVGVLGLLSRIIGQVVLGGSRLPS